MSEQRPAPWGRLTLLGLLAFLYTVSPLDLIPDFLPIGFADDLLLDGGFLGYLAYTLITYMKRRPEVPAPAEAAEIEAGPAAIALPPAQERSSPAKAGGPRRAGDRWGWMRYLALPVSLLVVGVFALQIVLAMVRAPGTLVQSAGDALTSVFKPTLTTSATVVVQGLRDKRELVVLEMETLVLARAKSEIWRGDAEAVVWAPAMVHYGVDLSTLGEDAVSLDKASNTLTVRVPAPTVTSVEVVRSRLEAIIRASGTRSPIIAGEYLRGLASNNLDAAARDAANRPANAASAREAAQRAVKGLVSDICARLGTEPLTVIVEVGPTDEKPKASR
jgi:hypothetical protein